MGPWANILGQPLLWDPCKSPAAPGSASSSFYLFLTPTSVASCSGEEGSVQTTSRASTSSFTPPVPRPESPAAATSSPRSPDSCRFWHVELVEICYPSDSGLPSSLASLGKSQADLGTDSLYVFSCRRYFLGRFWSFSTDSCGFGMLLRGGRLMVFLLHHLAGLSGANSEQV